MNELKKKATIDVSDKTGKDLIWLLFGMLWLTSGFNLKASWSLQALKS